MLRSLRVPSMFLRAGMDRHSTTLESRRLQRSGWDTGSEQPYLDPRYRPLQLVSGFCSTSAIRTMLIRCCQQYSQLEFNNKPQARTSLMLLQLDSFNSYGCCHQQACTSVVSFVFYIRLINNGNNNYLVLTQMRNSDFRDKDVERLNNIIVQLWDPCDKMRNHAGGADAVPTSGWRSTVTRSSWWRARVASSGSRWPSTAARARSTSLIFRTTNRRATWSSARGRTTASRSTSTSSATCRRSTRRSTRRVTSGSSSSTRPCATWSTTRAATSPIRTWRSRSGCSGLPSSTASRSHCLVYCSPSSASSPSCCRQSRPPRWYSVRPAHPPASIAVFVSR